MEKWFQFDFLKDIKGISARGIWYQQQATPCGCSPLDVELLGAVLKVSKFTEAWI